MEKQQQNYNDDIRRWLHTFDNYLKTLHTCDDNQQGDYLEKIKDLALCKQDYEYLVVNKFKKYIDQANKDKRERLLYAIDHLCKQQNTKYPKSFESEIQNMFVDIYYDYLRPNQVDIRKRLKILRKSWVDIFSQNVLNSMREKIKNQTNEDIDKGFTDQELQDLTKFYKRKGIDPYLQLPQLKKKLKEESKDNSSKIKHDNQFLQQQQLHQQRILPMQQSPSQQLKKEGLKAHSSQKHQQQHQQNCLKSRFLEQGQTIQQSQLQNTKQIQYHQTMQEQQQNNQQLQSEQFMTQNSFNQSQFQKQQPQPQLINNQLMQPQQQQNLINSKKTLQHDPQKLVEYQTIKKKKKDNFGDSQQPLFQQQQQQNPSLTQQNKIDNKNEALIKLIQLKGSNKAGLNYEHQPSFSQPSLAGQQQSIQQASLQNQQQYQPVYAQPTTPEQSPQYDYLQDSSFTSLPNPNPFQLDNGSQLQPQQQQNQNLFINNNYNPQIYAYQQSQPQTQVQYQQQQQQVQQHQFQLQNQQMPYYQTAGKAINTASAITNSTTTSAAASEQISYQQQQYSQHQSQQFSAPPAIKDNIEILFFELFITCKQEYENNKKGTKISFIDYVDQQEKNKAINMQNFKKNHGIAFNSLYKDLPYQCIICGNRFDEREQFQNHFDDEFKQNFKKLQLKNSDQVNDREREEFLDLKAWKEVGSQDQDTETKQNEEQEQYVEVDKALSNKCHLCQEQLDQIWKIESEKWIYMGVIQVQIEETATESNQMGKKFTALLHNNCYKLLAEQEESEIINEMQIQPKFILPSNKDNNNLFCQ